MKRITMFLVIVIFSVLIYSFIKAFLKYDSICNDCNVILISIDSLRADHLGSYGYQRNITPNIDNLARKSILFKNYITQSYLTPITEGSVHTSLYPSVHGISFVYMSSYDNRTISETPHLAEILKIYNYKTVTFSSSGEISTPRFKNKPFAKGFDEIYHFENRQLPSLFQISTWLDTNKNKKFFLYLPIGTIHQPFSHLVPDNFINEFDPPDYNGILKNYALDYPMFARIFNNTYYNISSIPIIEYNLSPSPYFKFKDYLNGDEHFNQTFTLSSADKDFIIGRYDVGIKYVDQYLGKLFEKLRELNLNKNTIIILTSEHGEDLGEHGYYWHYDIYDTQIHTPLIIVNPVIPNHKVIENQVQSIDIMPTILDFIGITPPTEAEGNSLKPLVFGNASSNFNKFVFIQRPLWEERVTPNINFHYDVAVRTNEWKLIYRMNTTLNQKISLWGTVTNKTIEIPEFELYNLKKDPYEQNNLIDKEPQVAEGLKQKLLDWLNQINEIKQKRMASLGNATQEIFPYP